MDFLFEDYKNENESYYDEEPDPTQIPQPIKGYPNYKVCSDGKIISNKTGRVLRPNVNSRGYESVSLISQSGAKPKTVQVHRIVAETFCPNWNRYSQVAHIDGNKTNNCADNLRWVPEKSSIRVRLVESGLIFESVSECARYLDVDTARILRCLDRPDHTVYNQHIVSVD